MGGNAFLKKLRSIQLTQSPLENTQEESSSGKEGVV